MTRAFKQGGIVASCGLVVCLAFVALGLQFGPPHGDVGLAGLLVGLALLAEFLPVGLSRRGLRMTFTLPYIVGIALIVGPVGAILADAFVALVGGVAATRGVGRSRVRWVAVNVAIAVLSTSGACAAFLPLSGPGGGDGQVALSALAFATTYVLLNLVLVAMAERLLVSRVRPEALWRDLRFAGQTAALYALFAITVALLVATDRGVFAVLTLVPVWALRTALDMQARLYAHYYETISALTLMLQRAHPYTHGHLERVAGIAEVVALELGLSPQRARLVREAAVLHDIGKIAVDEQILDLPRKLTDHEYAHIKMHSSYGAEILAQVPQFQPMVAWIRHHHERIDGMGYPARLTDEEIPIESKIISVADAFDAMVGTNGAQRTYRETMTLDEAMRELHACSGTQFDARVVATFERVLTGGLA